jgi:hypothetical protein
MCLARPRVSTILKLRTRKLGLGTQKVKIITKEHKRRRKKKVVKPRVAIVMILIVMERKLVNINSRGPRIPARPKVTTIRAAKNLKISNIEPDRKVRLVSAKIFNSKVL